MIRVSSGNQSSISNLQRVSETNGQSPSRIPTRVSGSYSSLKNGWNSEGDTSDSSGNPHSEALNAV